jgi:hypothetical protein
MVGQVPFYGVLVGNLPALTGAGVGEVPVAAAVVEVGSWYSLLSILNETRQLAAAERAQPRVACPNDGEPLRTGPRGQQYCPWDGYVDEGWH